MRIPLIILIFLHGLIHLISFSQAFGFANFKLQIHTVPRTLEVIGLLVGLLFILAGLMFLLKNEFWWIVGFIAIIVSQLLIIFIWQDAKFGTLPNLIILVTIIIAYSNNSFKQKVDKEVSQLFLKMETNKGETKSYQGIKELPLPVQKWLNISGVMKIPIIQDVYLKQDLLMKMNPGQKNWEKATAQQFFATKKPSFIWSVDMQMMSLINVVGRDKFEDGKGEMLIKVLSVFPVVDVKENEKVNHGTLQRYLAEVVWFPSAALSPYITWESIDNYSAKATMSYNGTTGSGIFYFNDDGDFKKFVAMRFKDVEKESELKEWIVEAVKSKVINGVKIPIELKATWKLDEGDWTWLKLKITEIQYNIEKPIVNTELR